MSYERALQWLHYECLQYNARIQTPGEYSQAIKGSQAKIKMVRLLQFSQSQCTSHLPSLRHFPSNLLSLERALNPRRLERLEDRPHRPRHVRQPTYSAELVNAVLKLEGGISPMGQGQTGDSLAS